MFDLPPDAVGSGDMGVGGKSNSGNERLKYKEKVSLVVKLQSETNAMLLFYSGLCHIQ